VLTKPTPGLQKGGGREKETIKTKKSPAESGEDGGGELRGKRINPLSGVRLDHKGDGSQKEIRSNKKKKASCRT